MNSWENMLIIFIKFFGLYFCLMKIPMVYDFLGLLTKTETTRVPYEKGD